MSTSSSRRLLTGLATAAVTLGLIALPTVASADPTPTPEAKSTVTASPRSTATASPKSSASPARASTAPSATATPPSVAPTEAPSAASPTATVSPTPSQATANEESAAPGPSPTGALPSTDDVQASGTRDANAAPAPTGSAASAPDLAAQAVAGASIALSKTVSPSRVSRVGQVVTYTFRATNDGSVPLTDVGITDELAGLTSTCPPNGASLAPGAVLSCTGTLTVTQAILDFGDIYNFATVFGSFPIEESEETDYVGANAAARVTVDQSPSIALSAAVSPAGTADRGDRLNYTGTATNTGNVTLTAARITSSLRALDLDCEPTAGATLAPGASISCSGAYRVSAADARRGRVSTTLTARAERPFGSSSSADDTTDAVRLRVAVTKPPATASADHGLADTGGPALPLGLAGLAAVGGGLVLLRRSRRA